MLQPLQRAVTVELEQRRCSEVSLYLPSALYPRTCSDCVTTDSSNLNADVQCLNECQSYYGQNKWIAGHRNGETGLNNPNTQDIRSKWPQLLWLKT
jgi:hypothetical protein